MASQTRTVTTSEGTFKVKKGSRLEQQASGSSIPAARGDEFAQNYKGGFTTETGLPTQKKGESNSAFASRLRSSSFALAGGESAPMGMESFSFAAPANVPGAPTGTGYAGTLAGLAAAMKVPEYGSTNEDGSVNRFDPNTGKPLKDPNAFDFAGLSELAMSLYGENPAPNQQKIYEQERRRAGIEQKQQDVSNRSAQLNSIIAKSQADQLAVTGQGRGIPEVIIGGQQAQIAKEAAIQALPVAAALSAAQGNLEMATQHLETVFKIRSEDAQNQFNFKNKVIDSVLGWATESEKMRLEEKKEASKNTLQVQRDNVAELRQWSQMAVQTGQSSLISAFAAVDPASPTFRQDLAAVQSRIVDPTVALDAEYKRAQINAANRSNQPTPTENLSNVTASIINNPSLFDDLTSTVRGNVIAELQAQGYDTSNLGTKSLSDSAIGQIAQTQKALSDLSELKTILQGNEKFLGPVSGLQALNPWSEARKVQADVNRVRQTVGKALEGGVLRKEDEEKYKQILATLTDTPDTAYYKVDALISSIQRDVETYKSLQQSAGRSLNVKSELPKQGATGKTLADYQKLY